MQAELLGQLGKIEQELGHTRNDVERFNANLSREIAGGCSTARRDRATERAARQADDPVGFRNSVAPLRFSGFAARSN